MNNLITIPFHNQTITAINHDGKPYIAMQPLVAHLGLDWAEQLVFINQLLQNPAEVLVLDAQTASEPYRRYLCIPLSNLSRYLYSVDANHVRIDLIQPLAEFKKQWQQLLNCHRLSLGLAINALIAPLLVNVSESCPVQTMIARINNAEILRQAA